MQFSRSRGSLGLFSIALLALAAGVAQGSLPCGPFTDLSGSDPFCAFVLEIFTLGITTGTTPTTYDPTSNVTRVQMAAFLSRSVDGVLKRGGRRAALRQYWTTQSAAVLGITTVGANPNFVESDGSDLWVCNFNSDSVSRVRGSDGTLLATWTGAAEASGVVVVNGRIVVGGGTTGKLYGIDPTQAAGAVATVATNVDGIIFGLAFDGARVWTANSTSVSKVTVGATTPWTVTTVSTGFLGPKGVLVDGLDVWVTDSLAGTLLRIDETGAILQTVTVGAGPSYPVFDGQNIWVPNNVGNSISVVRASTGVVLQTLTGNNMNGPWVAAFDGQRVLVTNHGGNNSVSLWKAADLTIAGAFPTGGGTDPYGACSDGVNFWITLNTVGKLARF